MRIDYYTHIPLPANYIERGDLLANLRTELLSDAASVALISGIKSAPTALHGMGGIGKSVLARALCDDPVVQSHFASGILWITLGQTPNLAARMREWIEVLGGSVSENAPTIEKLSSRLGQLLQERTCLLIIDDVWQAEHAQALNCGGERCKLIITTRNADIAAALGTDLFAVPTMSRFEAIELLDEWAGSALVAIVPGLKERVVDSLSCLPLAVELVGAQLRQRNIDDWLSDFATLGAEMLYNGNVGESLSRTFKRSLEALENSERTLYLALGIFKEDEPIPETAIVRLWNQHAEHLNSGQAARLLNKLSARALIQLVSRSGEYSIIFHDLIRDFVLAELTSSNRFAAHLALLTAYRQTKTGQGWHSAPDDAYLYDHLIYHLDAVNAVDELKALFVDQDWMTARVLQAGYIYDGYIDDLLLVWKRAIAESKAQAQANENSLAIVDCIRYLLIRTSINSVATNYAPEIVGRAVELGLWDVERAMSVAAKMPNAEQRANTYTALLKTEKLNELQRTKARDSGFRATLDSRLPIMFATDYSPIPTFVFTLANIISYLNEEQRAQALGTDIHFMLGYGWGRAHWSSTPLARLAPYFTDELVQQAVNIITQEHFYSYYLPESLPVLIPYLKGDQQIQMALYAYHAILHNIQQDADHINHSAAQIADLLPYLPAELHESALINGVKAVVECVREDDRVAGLIRFIPHVSNNEREQLVEQVLKLSLALDIGMGRSWQTCALFPYLSSEQQKEALPKIVEAAPYPGWLVNAVSQVMPYLTNSDQRDAILQIAFETALAETNVGQLAPFLDEPLLKRALDAQLQISNRGDEEGRCWALMALATHIHEPQKEFLLRWIFDKQFTQRDSSYPEFRARMFREIASFLPNDLLIPAFEETLQMYRSTRAMTLPALLPRLTEVEAERAFTAVQTRGSWDDDQIPSDLARIAPYLIGPSREQAIRLATPQIIAQRPIPVQNPNQASGGERQAARDHEMGYSFQLRTIAGQLQGSELLQAFDIAMHFQLDQYRVENLIAMIPNLPDKERLIAIQNAFESSKSWKFARVHEDLFTPLVPYLTDKLRNEALHIAYAHDNKPTSVFIMGRLIPYLSEWDKDSVRGQALDMGKAIDPESGSRARWLTWLLPQLDKPRMAEAVRICVIDEIAIIGEQGFSLDSASILANLMPLAENRDEILRILHESVFSHTITMENATRAAALQFCVELGKMPPLVISGEVYGKIANTFLDICENWRWL